MLGYIQDTLSETLNILFEMSPYILIGLLFAGVLKIVLPEGFIKKQTEKNRALSPLMASLLGIPLPLCSCSVIPFAISIRKEGASRGTTLAFLTSTPQTGVDSMMVSWSFLGLPFTLFKTVTAFITGTVGGWLSDFLITEDQSNVAVEPCEGCEDPEQAEAGNTIFRIFDYGFRDLLGDFAALLLIGIIVSGTIAALVPTEWFSVVSSNWLYYPAVLILSIPFYICATASLPLAFTLVEKGMPPGAALILLIAGPATNIATITIVAKILGKRGAVIYVVNIILWSIVAALLFDSILKVGVSNAVSPTDPLRFPFAVEVASGIILAGLCIYHIINRIKSGERLGEVLGP